MVLSCPGAPFLQQYPPLVWTIVVSVQSSRYIANQFALTFRVLLLFCRVSHDTIRHRPLGWPVFLTHGRLVDCVFDFANVPSCGHITVLTVECMHEETLGADQR